LTIFVLITLLFGTWVNIYSNVQAIEEYSSIYEVRVLNVINTSIVNRHLKFSMLSINKTVSFNVSTCLARLENPNFNISYSIIVNDTKDEYSLIFLNVHTSGIVNDTYLNYTFYMLLYKASKAEYNVSVMTIIYTDPANQSRFIFYETTANIQPVEERSIQVMDIVNILNRTTLSQHYRILAKTLNHVKHKEKITKWIWTKLSHELNNLSKIVKHKLKSYNKQEAYGIGIIIDDPIGCAICTAACILAIYGGCSLACMVYPVICFYCIDLLYYAVEVGLGCRAACALIGWCP